MAELSADFEESEFRGPLFNQLLRGNNLLWEPGQVFEEHILKLIKLSEMAT